MAGRPDLGFAGFFGLPVAYTPLATQARRPQLPALLPPAFDVTDCIVQPGAATRARQTRLGLSDQWLSASSWPGCRVFFWRGSGPRLPGQTRQLATAGQAGSPQGRPSGPAATVSPHPPTAARWVNFGRPGRLGGGCAARHGLGPAPSATGAVGGAWQLIPAKAGVSAPRATPGAWWRRRRNRFGAGV